MKFVNRWCIEGTLTTRTPLRIGDGSSIEAAERPNSKHLKGDVKIATVAVDCNHNAFIPATTIKGNIRTWAVSCGFSEEVIDILFGSRDPQAPHATAGKVQFGNAFVAETQTFNFAVPQPPGWDPHRLTAVTASIAVDRIRRVASEQKLFHQEYVPPGIRFDFQLSGNDYDLEAEDEARAKKREDFNATKYKAFKEANLSLLGKDGLIVLLALLRGFNERNGIALGAVADRLEKAWGRLTWKTLAIKQLDGDGVKDWLAKSSDSVGYEIVTRMLARETLEHEAKKKQEKLFEIAKPSEHISVQVTLHCLDNFLVNDPSQTRPLNYQQDRPDDEDEENKKPDHAPLRDSAGYSILPRSSVKGAVRSQAEKILRTMAAAKGFPQNAILQRIACYPDDQKRSCLAVKEMSGAKKLCLACQMFGAAGWRSPFQCTPFVALSEMETMPQEFVAIDRFTGSVSGSAKFDARSFYRPHMVGEFDLDLLKLKTIGADSWPTGLLALVLRDLAEGDIRVGFGRAKGYGEIRATFKEIGPPDALDLAVKALESKIADVAGMDKTTGAEPVAEEE